ncbi:MAG: alpha/beta hydrolase family protein [Myxococcaceae bacterium]
MGCVPRTSCFGWAALLVVLGAGCNTPLQPGAPGAPQSSPETPPPTFRSGAIDLAYALDIPPGSGPFPGAVLVHGSGPSSRNDLRFLSQLLVARGIAVLRYDKRGVGDSGGVYSGVGIFNSAQMIPLLASDAAAGVEFLAARPEVDGTRVGLVGGSQAGWIIPVAASLAPRVAFAVILSGPTVSVGREIAYSDLVEGDPTFPLDAAEDAVAAYQGPEGFDPRPSLEQSTVPMLWLYGLVDRSIPTRACLAIHAELQVSHPFEVLTYPNLGHALSSGAWTDVYPWLDARLAR